MVVLGLFENYKYACFQVGSFKFNAGGIIHTQILEKDLFFFFPLNQYAKYQLWFPDFA